MGECSSSCEGSQSGYHTIVNRALFGGTKCDENEDYIIARDCNMDKLCDQFRVLPMIEYDTLTNNGQISMKQTNDNGNIYLSNDTMIYEDQQDTLKYTAEFVCVFTTTSTDAVVHMGMWDENMYEGVCIIMSNLLIEVRINSVSSKKAQTHVFNILEDVSWFDANYITSGGDVEVGVNYVRNKYFVDTLVLKE